MSDSPDDLGVTISSGIPIPVLWERDGRAVRWVFAGDAAEPEDRMIFSFTYEAGG